MICDLVFYMERWYKMLSFYPCRNIAEAIPHHGEWCLLHVGLGEQVSFGPKLKVFLSVWEHFDCMSIEDIIGWDSFFLFSFFFHFGCISSENAFSHNYLE